MTNRKNYMLIVSFVILALFVMWNFYNVFINAVDVPYWDEWETLLPGHLDSKLNWNWIFSFHNEHKIVWTKLYTWIFYHIDGWNLRHQIITNFFLFLTSLGLLYKVIPDKNSLLPLFFIPCLADVNFENQLTGFQSQFYFMLIFAFIAIYFGFVKQKNLRNTILFSIFTVCSMFSMTFAAGIGLLIAFIIKERKLNKYSLTAFLIIAAGILLFFANYGQLTEQMPLMLPDNLVFWTKYFKSIFVGVLNICFSNRISVMAGAFISVIAVYLFIKEKNNSDFYIYLALFSLSLCLIGAIGCGRFSDENILYVSSRHLLVINFLIPCIAALFYRYKQYKLCLLYLIILFCGFMNAFSYERYICIKEDRQRDKFVLSIMLDKNKDNVIIPELYPSNLTSYIKRGKLLNISSFRKHQS